MSLDSQTTKFGIVINIPHDYKYKSLDLLPVCRSLFSEYHYILHDKDVLPSGDKKTPHYHLVARTAKRTRLATIINKLSDGLKINTSCISVQVCSDMVGAVQYLIHKNDTEKYQYESIDIVSSYSQEDLELILTSENNGITLDRLYLLIKTSKTLYEIMIAIGLKAYISYRNVIKDLWSEKHLY